MHLLRLSQLLLLLRPNRAPQPSTQTQYCLLEQKFLLDDATTVKALLDARARELSLPGPLAVSGLLRLQVGEGLERADSKPDFAAEVAAMAGGQ